MHNAVCESAQGVELLAVPYVWLRCGSQQPLPPLLVGKSCVGKQLHNVICELAEWGSAYSLQRPAVSIKGRATVIMSMNKNGYHDDEDCNYYRIGFTIIIPVGLYNTKDLMV